MREPEGPMVCVLAGMGLVDSCHQVHPTENMQTSHEEGLGDNAGLWLRSFSKI
jgi:hypothetical protein